jgi:hypothetical protein
LNPVNDDIWRPGLHLRLILLHGPMTELESLRMAGKKDSMRDKVASSL